MRERLLACNFGLFGVRRIDFRTVDLRLVAMFQRCEEIDSKRTRQSSFGYRAVNDPENRVTGGERRLQPTRTTRKPNKAIQRVKPVRLRCSSELQQLSP
jgi:hypothetical protein